MEARQVRIERALDRRDALALFAILLTACGYRPLRSGLKGSPKIRVLSAATVVAGNAYASLAEEIATGARGELAKYGALANEDATDRLKLEVVRLDEQSEGVEIVEGKPHARGVRIRLTARGVIEGASGAWETSDIEATEMVATPADALGWDAARGAAARGLARRAGALVAREVLGIP
jgi:hypothetical protein